MGFNSAFKGLIYLPLNNHNHLLALFDALQNPRTWNSAFKWATN